MLRQKNFSMKKKAVVFLVAIAAVIVFILVGWPFQVRFTHPPLNYWAVAGLFFAIPFGVLAMTWFFQGRTLRGIIVVAAVLVGIPAGVLGLVVSSDASRIQNSGVDSSFELLQEISSGKYWYRLYRTNCGATCALGLVLRKEFVTPFGLSIVNVIWSKYREDDAQLSLGNHKEIRIISQGTILATIRI